MTDALHRIDIAGAPSPRRGKVRDVFDLGDRLIIAATDRISAFDCVLPTPIPDKGRVLNLMSVFWFGRTSQIVPNHLVTTDIGRFPEPYARHSATLAGRSMLVVKTEPLPVECIVRGYLAGGGWKEYRRLGSICGVPLAEGLPESERLPAPIFTPTTKAETGHDESISFDEMSRLVGATRANRVRDISLRIYEAAAQYARERGIIIADTKFEFGVRNGELMLIDEVLTPDSSRFWPADGYEAGRSQPSMDKQFVRDYLETLDWDKTPPAPPLPPDVLEKTAARYREAHRRITGNELD